MPKSIQPVRVNHLNVVLENYDTSVAHFQDLYDAEFLLDLRKPEMNACLINIGDVIFELFAPPIYLVNSRYGPHYLGIEYQADMAVVRENLTARGIRIVRDIDVALHVHPADCFGIAFEFWSSYFHQNEPILGRKMKPPAYWQSEHPLGLCGLKAYTVAVNDIEAAQKFMQEFLSAEVVYKASRPNISACAVGLQAADAVIELLTPTEDGPLQKHLVQYGQGIRSTVFGVCNIDRARRYFAERNVTLTAGAAPNTFAVPAEANLGVIFEFAE